MFPCGKFSFSAIAEIKYLCFLCSELFTVYSFYELAPRHRPVLQWASLPVSNSFPQLLRGNAQCLCAAHRWTGGFGCHCSDNTKLRINACVSDAWSAGSWLWYLTLVSPEYSHNCWNALFFLMSNNFPHLSHRIKQDAMTRAGIWLNACYDYA